MVVDFVHTTGEKEITLKYPAAENSIESRRNVDRWSNYYSQGDTGHFLISPTTRLFGINNSPICAWRRGMFKVNFHRNVEKNCNNYNQEDTSLIFNPWVNTIGKNNSFWFVSFVRTNAYSMGVCPKGKLKVDFHRNLEKHCNNYSQGDTGDL